jgi:prepilin-type N-terminal cleavage/methylation domain-containing protein
MKIKINNNGFTLLELLIVVALITILVSMVLMATKGSWIDANKKLTESTIALLDSALEEYREYKTYDPTSNLIFPNPNALSAIVDFNSPMNPYPFETSHSASLYAQLDLVPEAKKVLERLDNSQVNLEKVFNKYPVFFDAWKTPLNYLYVDGMNFPLIISAGPDKKFDTTDDITNKK